MVVGITGIWRRIAREYAWELTGLLGLYVGVYLAHDKLGMKWLSISAVPVTIVGSAVGVLLGFRSNEAYNRYNEARTLWGSVVNSSRSLARQILSLVSSEQSPDAANLQREAIFLQIGYAHALRQQLWKRPPIDDIAEFLPPSEVERFRSERNVADAILAKIACLVHSACHRGWLHPMHVPVLQQTLTDLSNAQGGCERIKNTPIPRSYTYVASKIVLLYTFMVPFGLVDPLGKAMPLAALLISFVFPMLDRFSNLIEDPFCTTYSGLPLVSITRTIEINLRQRLGQTDLPADVQPVDGILR